jgi:hypothetical protein
MAGESRAIATEDRKLLVNRKFIEVYRERGYFVVHNRLTHQKHYYSQVADVLRILYGEAESPASRA